MVQQMPLGGMPLRDNRWVNTLKVLEYRINVRGNGSQQRVPVHERTAVVEMALADQVRRMSLIKQGHPVKIFFGE